MLCDGSINDKPWEVGISPAYGREHRQIGELASNIPILLEESGNIDVSLAETLCKEHWDIGGLAS